MPRMPLHLASGTGEWKPTIAKAIRLVRYGCTNRPFYHIVVMNRWAEQRRPPIEQLGTYDPCENKYGEKLVAFNFERIQYWLGQGNVSISLPVEELFGLAGFLPIHPRTYMAGWRQRRNRDAANVDTAEGEEKKVADSN